MFPCNDDTQLSPLPPPPPTPPTTPRHALLTPQQSHTSVASSLPPLLPDRRATASIRSETSAPAKLLRSTRNGPRAQWSVDTIESRVGGALSVYGSAADEREPERHRAIRVTQTPLSHARRASLFVRRFSMALPSLAAESLSQTVSEREDRRLDQLQKGV